MNFRLRTLTLASIAIAALGLASVVTPVHPREKAKERPKDTRHCVTDLSQPDTPTTCYDTFTAAIAAATDGLVTDAPADPRAAMNDQGLLVKLNATGDKKSTAAIEPRSHVLIATIFWNDHYGTPTHSYKGSRTCTGQTTDIDYQVPYVGDRWNDNFESIKTFSNCWARLWEHSNFQGSMLDFAGDRPDFGSLNDEVSSLQFS